MECIVKKNNFVHVYEFTEKTYNSHGIEGSKFLQKLSKIESAGVSESACLVT